MKTIDLQSLAQINGGKRSDEKWAAFQDGFCFGLGVSLTISSGFLTAKGAIAIATAVSTGVTVGCEFFF